MRFSGTSPDGSLVEVIELPEHPWFVAVQYHPEFKSKPTVPQPLFAGLVGAAVARSQGRAERPAPSSMKDRTGQSPAVTQSAQVTRVN
jgi:CTP synthase